MRRAGLAPAVALAREQGLPADDPRVLSSRGNLLVHLAPAPVVARVATLTAWTRSDPFVASQAANAAEALAAYAGVTGEPTPAPEALAPFSRARDLEAAVWILGMAHQYPARYRERARPLLDRVLRNSQPAR